MRRKKVVDKKKRMRQKNRQYVQGVEEGMKGNGRLLQSAYIYRTQKVYIIYTRRRCKREMISVVNQRREEGVESRERYRGDDITPAPTRCRA